MGIFPIVNGGQWHTASLSPSHCPDMTEILLKGGNIAGHPPIHQFWLEAEICSIIIIPMHCPSMADILLKGM